MRIHYRAGLTDFARILRKSGTPAEVLLWKELKGKNLRGYKFLRQKPIENYVVDFFCPMLRFAIEIDDVTHDSKTDENATRQAALEQLGISFLRFTEGEVRGNLDGVLRDIGERLTPLASPTRHSPY